MSLEQKINAVKAKLEMINEELNDINDRTFAIWNNNAISAATEHIESAISELGNTDF